MSATRTMGISVTDVDTTAQLPLGFEYHEPAGSDDQGEAVWIYVFNDEASPAFAQGHIIMRDAATTTYDGVLTPGDADVPALRIIGVAQHAIAAGSYGFILRKGIGEVQKDAVATAANVTLIASDAGTAQAGRACIDSGGGTSDVFAFATEAAAGTSGGELLTCMINCVG